jgi:transcriptional regulator with XRE-family HTH domain
VIGGGFAVVPGHSAIVPLPADAWEDAHMRRAWRTRDFRAVFHLACRLGLTAEIIATNAGLPLDLVLNVMKGNTVLNGNPAVAVRVAVGLGMPDDFRRFAGIAPPADSDVSVPRPGEVKPARPDQQTDRIERRPHVGDRIAQLRRERGLTQESLAERAGISRETVKKIERQKRSPSLSMLEILAEALGVPVGDLINPPAPRVLDGRLPELENEEHPGQLLLRSALQPAIESESFGAELARLMDRRGIGVRELARRTDYTAGYISNLRTGAKAPSPMVARILDSALEAGGRLIEIERHVASDQVPQPLRRPQASRVPDKSEDEFGIGRSEDVLDVLSRIQELHRGTIHPEIIRQLQDYMRHTVARYEKLDHSSLVPALLKQRAWIDSLLDECSHPRQQQQLFEIAGAASGVLGYVAVGRGDFPLARAYCLEAFQLGDFAGDANLQAWARGLQSFCEYYAGRYDDALNLASDGLKYAQSGPQSVRLTINGTARAMGKLGDAEGVHRAVAEAYDLMSRNDAPSGVPSSITFGCYSAAQTASNAATAYVSLGMAEEVQHYVELALPDISKSESPWSRSLVMIDLALSVIRSKEPDLDRAAELILDALSISAGRPIISVEQRTWEFIRDATGRWGDTPQVGALRDAAATLKAR